MMTLSQAVETWKSIEGSVTADSLNDKARHELVHELSRVFVEAIKSGQITYDQYEAMTSKGGKL